VEEFSAITSSVVQQTKKGYLLRSVAVMRRLLALATFFALVAAGAAPSAQPRRVVAIGDVHGAFEELKSILQGAGLADASGQWTGGTTTFVQTGDVTDRGKDVRSVLDLLMALEPKAERAGGRAIVLLGNHEVMNLVGEQRDATPEIYATFADGESEARRERAWAQYEELVAARTKVRPNPAEAYTKTKETWMAEHPPGWLEYREAFSPRGKYGKWLRDRRAAVKVGDTLFMHAGINPMTTEVDAEAADSRVRQEIAKMDRYVERVVAAKVALPFFTLQELLQVAAGEIRAVNAVMTTAKETGNPPDLKTFDVEIVKAGAEVLDIGSWNVLAENGPMWYRGYAAAPEATLRDPVTAMLAKNEVARIVVAHTPSAERRILSRLDGRVVLIDTGMLAGAYRGRPSALEISGNQLTAIYSDGRVPLNAARPSP
jgi:hypothetical protein